MYTAPGVFFEAQDEAAGQVRRLRTDIAGFTGVCERGPLDTPVRVTSWEQFRTAFGNLISNALLPWAVKAFFENGGQRCWIVRVAAPEATSSSAGVQPADRMSSIVPAGTTNGFAAGAAVTLMQSSVTFTSALAQPADRLSSLIVDPAGFTQGSLVRIVQAAKPSTYAHLIAVDAVAKQFFWDRALDPAYDITLPIELHTTQQRNRLLLDADATTLFWSRPVDDVFDLLRPIDFATGASAASAMLLDQHSNPTLRVDAASTGAWGNELQVSVARTSLHATRTTGAQPASGLSSNVESVTGFGPGTVVRLFQNGAGITHRVVTHVDYARRSLVWSTAIVLPFDVTKPIAFESVEFTITVSESGRIREAFEDLSLERTDRNRYAPDVVNARSRFIRIDDQLSPSPVPESNPDPQSPALDRGRLVLRGGRDGIAALRTIEVTGSMATDERKGLRALELIDEVAILAIPDVLIERVPPVESAPPPQPPEPDPCFPAPPAPPVAIPPPPKIREQSATFSEDEIVLVQSAMIDQCERLLDRFTLLDPPNFRSTDFGEIESWRRRFETKYAALYFPWIVVVDPLSRGASLTRALPPSGHVAGIYARSDLAIGVHKAPANEELQWAQDVTLEVTQNLHEVLNPIGVNAIRSIAARGLRVNGARTVSSDPAWRYVNVRRLISMIEEALDESLQWAVFEPNNDQLRVKVATAIAAFLEQLWLSGMLAGKTLGEAFYVDAHVDEERLLAEVGVAPAIPAEYVVVRVGRTEDVLEISEPEGAA
ncbi:MAG TPA: phage tail sheath C-terminal domain-containing protein [Thermoanaerobaculia bacterium]|nr:phage tail sheath C-terminal domain-containing protein [Thermoanaerobaculia bacterium]